MKQVVLLTPGQPSSNPRIVKEAIALADAGYRVKVIYNFWVKWADAADKELIKNNPQIEWVRTGGHPEEEKMKYLFTRVRYKFFRILAAAFPGSITILKHALIRAFYELQKETISTKASVYIAHNLGALAAASNAASKNKSVFAFDAEDYHRGQVQEGSADFLKYRKTEDAFLPGAVYCSAASPLIAEKYKEHYPGMNVFTVNNVFSKKYLQGNHTLYSKGSVLKLFWFSQTVGKQRGLEEVIAAMGLLKHLSVSLTVLGACSEEMKFFFTELAKKNQVSVNHLLFLQPVMQHEIFSIAAQHHIGIAVETEQSVNRQICLTNKIFTYLLSGNAVIANNTKAQELFFKTYPGAGCVFENGNIQQLSTIISELYHEDERLSSMQKNNLQLAASELNWEKEQQLLLNNLESVLN